MITSLAFFMLGDWSYARFLAEPNPAPAPIPAPESIPAREAPISLEPVKPTQPAEVPRQADQAQPFVPTMPTLYRLADVSGQVWEHPDPADLSRFVEDRNRWLAPLVIHRKTDVSPRQRKGTWFTRRLSSR